MEWLLASPLVIRIFAVFVTIDKVNALMESQYVRNT